MKWGIIVDISRCQTYDYHTFDNYFFENLILVSAKYPTPVFDHLVTVAALPNANA